MQPLTEASLERFLISSYFTVEAANLFPPSMRSIRVTRRGLSLIITLCLACHPSFGSADGSVAPKEGAERWGEEGASAIELINGRIVTGDNIGEVADGYWVSNGSASLYVSREKVATIRPADAALVLANRMADLMDEQRYADLVLLISSANPEKLSDAAGSPLSRCCNYIFWESIRVTGSRVVTPEEGNQLAEVIRLCQRFPGQTAPAHMRLAEYAVEGASLPSGSRLTDEQFDRQSALIRGLHALGEESAIHTVKPRSRGIKPVPPKPSPSASIPRNRRDAMRGVDPEAYSWYVPELIEPHRARLAAQVATAIAGDPRLATLSDKVMPEDMATLRAAVTSGQFGGTLLAAEAHQYGWVVERDPVRSYGLYVQAWRVATTLGESARAAYRIAQCHDLGVGTAYNPAEATQWYRHAARAGDPNSMMILAKRIAETDYPNALGWVNKAAALGNEEAVQVLAMLEEADAKKREMAVQRAEELRRQQEEYERQIASAQVVREQQREERARRRADADTAALMMGLLVFGVVAASSGGGGLEASSPAPDIMFGREYDVHKNPNLFSREYKDIYW